MRVQAIVGHPSGWIVPGVVYEVVNFSDSFFLVLDRSGEPYLYEREMFSIEDAKFPNDWVRSDSPDGAYYGGGRSLR